MEDINWETDIWTVIDNYFKTIPNYLSRNQLDSYNTFLKTQISKTIRQFNPIELPYSPYGDSNIHQYEIKIIMGGSTPNDKDLDSLDESEIKNEGKNIYISKPIIQHKSEDDSSKDEKQDPTLNCENKESFIEESKD